MRSLRSLLVLLLAAPLAGLADPDPAAYARQQQEIERKEGRELQKVDQAEKLERIKLDSRKRDDLAKIQRDINSTAMSSTAAVVATGSMAAIDTAKLSQYQFLQNELDNQVANQLEPAMQAPFNRERKAINRKYALERAKLDANQVSGDDAAKQRDQAVRLAELADKYQQQLDDLDLELAAETAKLRFAHMTKINAAERDLGAMVSKHVMDNAAKGSAAAAYNPATDPEYNKLVAARDSAKNALQTALDELNAKFDVKRTDINNALEDDKAKVTSG